VRFSGAFFLNNYVQIYAGKCKAYFYLIDKFFKLFLVKLQASTLDESHHLLVILNFSVFSTVLGCQNNTLKFCNDTPNSELPCIEVKRFEESLFSCTWLLQQML